MSWLDLLESGEPSHERDVVERYSVDLINLARQRLPNMIKGRVDPEDVVQSVYRSFFRRLRNGDFTFEESYDVWRLLVVMTYHKVKNVTKHHRRQKRDAVRDFSYQAASPDATPDLPGPSPQPDDLAVMMDYLQKLLDELPERHHQLVVLRLEGHSIGEIAEQLNVSRRTVLRVLGQVKHLAERMMGDAQ